MATIAPPVSLNAALREISAEMDRQFDALLPVPGDPRANLYRAMRHAAIGGGKRLRPLLVFATARLFNVERTRAARAALAIRDATRRARMPTASGPSSSSGT